jgi:hypothetical protein
MNKEKDMLDSRGSVNVSEAEILEYYIAGRIKDVVGNTCAVNIEVEHNPPPSGTFAIYKPLGKIAAAERPVTFAQYILNDCTSETRSRLIRQINAALGPVFQGNLVTSDNGHPVPSGYSAPDQFHFYVKGQPAVLLRQIGTNDEKGFERLAHAKDVLVGLQR